MRPTATALPAAVLRGVIRAYQLTFSAWLGRQCRFGPSCSEYAMEAVGRYGVLRGGWLAIKRVCRCHPWGGSGYDPVPEPIASNRGAAMPDQSPPHRPHTAR